METLKKICEHLEDTVLAELGKDKAQVDAKELGEVVDAIKDIKMAIYYASITEAMEDAEYGKDYDENGRFYTPSRNAMGQYTRRPYMYEPNMEHYRDMDSNMGRMYYTDTSNMGSNNGYRESRYERARRGYEESKQMHPDLDNMKAMEKVFDAFEEDLQELKSKMSQNERTIAKNKLSNMSNMLM